MITHPQSGLVHTVVWLVIGLLSFFLLIDVIKPVGEELENWVWGLFAAGSLNEVLFG